MRTRLVNRTLNPLLATLPDKFVDIPEHQVDAITEIASAFLDDNVKVVALEAPTGSGKTLIAECVRRILETRATYVCHNKDLQVQFSKDFPYSQVLWGRDNYTPEKRGNRVTCADCTWTPNRPNCILCSSREVCPYVKAKTEAIHSPVPVLNSAYWLNETQSKRSRFANTGLAVFDEADTIEQVLMGQVEVYVSERAQGRYGIDPPARLTKIDSYRAWCKTALDRLQPHLARLENTDFHSVQEARELRRLVGLVETINGMAADLDMKLPWVYTGGAGSARRNGNEIAFKPVKVERFGKTRIWDKDKRFLLMSGTMVSPGQLLGDLGWDGPYAYVKIDSIFHPKNRQVVVRPVADMSRKGMTASGFSQLRINLLSTLQDHEGQRGLIHSVSYSLTDNIVNSLRDSGRRVFTYRSSGDRAGAIREYLATPSSVLVAPSIDRGLDLPDDLCRWQVIVKVPYLSLGDKQVSERLYNTNDGKLWYQVHVARSLMQMVGRGVRSTDDYCTAYILDSGFIPWYRAWGHLFPTWFRKAIRVESVQ